MQIIKTKAPEKATCTSIQSGRLEINWASGPETMPCPDRTTRQILPSWEQTLRGRWLLPPSQWVQVESIHLATFRNLCLQCDKNEFKSHYAESAAKWKSLIGSIRGKWLNHNLEKHRWKIVLALFPWLWGKKKEEAKSWGLWRKPQTLSGSRSAFVAHVMLSKKTEMRGRVFGIQSVTLLP